MAVTPSMDALLNEYKGSLFEYLVAKTLAHKFEIETEFLHSLNEDQMGMLSQQEKYLRNLYPKLLASLPTLALNCCDQLVSQLKIKTLASVCLVGMNAKAASEVDLTLDCGDQQISISLKLSRLGSYTNTKSAGVKSFFEKYFKMDQSQFNQFYERTFLEFTYNMYREAGEEPSHDFKRWEQLGLPTLPGKLDEDFRVHLLDFYQQINDSIFSTLKALLEQDSRSFLEALTPLAGFSSDELVQVTSFYKEEENKFITSKTLIKSSRDIESEGSNRVELKKADNNLKIIHEKFSLLIRLKPMNKFTHKSYKINCALKFS